MSLDLIIPETPDLIPDRFAQQVCDWVATVDSIDTVDECRRRAAALRSYVSKREHKTELHKAERWCEVRIGELLKTDGVQHQCCTIGVADKDRFRILARHRPKVAAMLARDIVSRAKILAAIDAKKRGERAAHEGHFSGVKDGDFREVLDEETVKPGSVDLVLTDPPYAEEHIGLWADLGAFAARVLHPGGSLVAYSGQATMPDALDALRSHLRYWWTLALIHKHGGQQLPGKWVMSEWKPILWFVKQHREGRSFVADTVSGAKPRKDAHEWAQGTSEAIYLIEQLTEAGALVVDPFSGSGTVAIAAKETGRRFVGAEINPRKAS